MTHPGQRVRDGYSMFTDVERFANSIGQLAVVFYITLAIISMNPFHCYLHPNGKTSVIECPTVLRDDSGKYPDMSAMGIIGVSLNVPGGIKPDVR